MRKSGDTKTVIKQTVIRIQRQKSAVATCHVLKHGSVAVITGMAANENSNCR